MRLLPRVLRAFPESVAANDFLTRGPGDEDRLTAQAVRLGAQTIVCVGGDGTATRVANALLRGGTTSVALAVIPSGTGNDFAKTLGVLKMDVEAITSLVRENQSHRIDVGRVDGKYFVNSCGFGFDAFVLDASNGVTWLKGNAVYIYSALVQLFAYEGVGISVEGQAAATKLMLTVSNGSYLGGAFHIAPGASVVDGLLDVNYFDNCGVLDRIRAFAGAVRGTHQRLAFVRSETRRSLTLEFGDAPLMELDGELRRAASTSVRIECVPRVLSVIAAQSAAL